MFSNSSDRKEISFTTEASSKIERKFHSQNHKRKNIKKVLVESRKEQKMLKIYLFEIPRYVCCDFDSPSIFDFLIAMTITTTMISTNNNPSLNELMVRK
jgi:hypothetical protein